MKKNLILVFTFALLLGNALFWSSQKEGFHTDEMFSYEQVGNTVNPKPEYDRENEPSMNFWHNKAYYEDYLLVDADEAFDLAGFYRSATTNTAHPPLYLTLFGMYISAFFQNNFTKWSGISLNLIFYCLTLLVLFDLSQRVLKKKPLSVFTVFLYGIGVGTVSTIVFIRVYMILTFFSVAYVDIHARMMEKEADLPQSAKTLYYNYLPLILCFILGGLSQYYFLILAFFISFFFCVFLLILHRFRSLASYILVMTAGFLGYLASWPYFFRDVFDGDRGTQVRYYAANAVGKYSQTLIRFIRLYDDYTLGGIGVSILLVLLIVKLFMVYAPKLEQKEDRSFALIYHRPVKTMETETGNSFGIEWLIIVELLFSCLCYFLVVSKISPNFSDFSAEMRYITNIIPCTTVILVFLIEKLLFKNNLFWKRISLTLMLAATLLGYGITGVNYLYKGTTGQLSQLEAYANCRAIYIEKEGFFPSNLSYYLAKSPYAYVTYLSGTDQMIQDMDKSGDTEFLLYVACEIMDETTLGGNSALQDMLNSLELKDCSYLFETATLHPASVFYLRR